MVEIVNLFDLRKTSHTIEREKNDEMPAGISRVFKFRKRKYV